MAILLEFAGFVLGIIAGWVWCAKASATAVLRAVRRHRPEDIEDQAIEMSDEVFKAICPGPTFGWVDRHARHSLERDGQQTPVTERDDDV